MADGKCGKVILVTSQHAHTLRGLCNDALNVGVPGQRVRDGEANVPVGRDLLDLLLLEGNLGLNRWHTTQAHNHHG